MTVQCDIANLLFKEIIRKETDKQKKIMIESMWHKYYNEIVKLELNLFISFKSNKKSMIIL